METVVTGKGTEVKFGQRLPTVMIAERINPTGRKSLAEELKQGKLDIVREDARKQTEAGGHIIDINVGAVGVDEVEMLPRAVQAVMEESNQPICLDSANPAALKAAIKIYPYKVLINSVTGEEKSMENLLPVVAESGSAIICLVLDEDGIPDNVAKRLQIAKKIITRTESMGIKPENLVFDSLVMTNSTNTESAKITIETMRQLVAEYGVATTGGYSNVSFGMPNRDLLNTQFISMGIMNGLTAPITDPLIPGLAEAMRASDFLAGRDPYGMNFISSYRK
ncbi:MAG: pterin-binding protein [Actinomycetota bacterium]|nr:MAG: pterin-binding protein [Actinomycetota bacterium]